MNGLEPNIRGVDPDIHGLIQSIKTQKMTVMTVAGGYCQAISGFRALIPGVVTFFFAVPWMQTSSRSSSAGSRIRPMISA